MPSNRNHAAQTLPRWITDPEAADFASPERLAFEATAGRDGLACCGKPFSRFMYALGLLYGQDQWPSDLAKLPRWPGDWRPGRYYDPSAYELLPDGPPEALRDDVAAHQAKEDERMRQLVTANVPGHAGEMLRKIGTPQLESDSAASWPRRGSATAS